MNLFTLIDLVGGVDPPIINAEFSAELSTTYRSMCSMDYYVFSKVDTVIYSYIDGVCQSAHNIAQNTPTIIKASYTGSNYEDVVFSIKFNNADITRFGFYSTGWQHTSVDVSMFASIEQLTFTGYSFYSYNTSTVTVDVTGLAKLKKFIIHGARVILVADALNVIEYIRVIEENNYAKIGDIALYTNLKYLEYKNTNNEATNPYDFSQNTQLEEIHVKGGSITASTPLNVTGLTALNVLSLELSIENGILDLSAVPQLTELYCKTGEIDLSYITTLTNLRKFTLDPAYVSTPTYTAIDLSALVNLEYLYINYVYAVLTNLILPANNKITDLTLYLTDTRTAALSIAHLVNLKSLALRYYTGVPNISTFTLLEKYNVMYTQAMPDMTLYPNLEWLNINGSVNGGLVFGALASPEKLKYLSVSHMANSIDFSQFTGLESLYAYRNYWQGTYDFENNSVIKSVNVSSYAGKPATTVNCTNCTSLESLDTYVMPYVTLSNTQYLQRCDLGGNNVSGSTATISNCSDSISPTTLSDELIYSGGSGARIKTGGIRNVSITNCTLTDEITLEGSPVVDSFDMTGTSASYGRIGVFNMETVTANNVTLSANINVYDFNCLLSTASKNAHMVYLNSLGTSNGTWRCKAGSAITGDGIIARDALISRGWTIDEDN